MTVTNWGVSILALLKVNINLILIPFTSFASSSLYFDMVQLLDTDMNFSSAFVLSADSIYYGLAE